MATTFFRRCSNHSEEEKNELRKESADLPKTHDEVSRQKGAPSDCQNNHIYEKILALETLRAKNSQYILAIDQEIASLWQLLWSDRAEVVANLHAQLNQQGADAERKERLFQSLKEETEEVRNKLAAVSTRCQENTSNSGTADGHAATGNSTLIEEQLKDALKKNQQWLVYDQQREAYVRAVLAKMCQLEQELLQARKALRLREVDSEEKQDVETQQCYEKLVGELMREQQKGQQLLTQHHQVWMELEKEMLKSAELQQQVNILQKSLLNQHEDQSRITVLEQQIQLSTKNLEDEKCDNQHLQWQLHRVLKELRKATDKVAILESEKAQRESSSSSSSVLNTYTELERVPKERLQSFSSPIRAHNLLDESFLECPSCRAQYPTSHYRELLLHVDQCFGEN